MKRRTIKVIVWVALLSLLIAGIFFVGLIIRTGQAFSSPFIFVTRSPDHRHEASFLLEGFVDRGWTLFVKNQEDRRPQRVTELDWDGVYRFSRARWTKDGQAIVVTLGVAEHAWQEFNAYGFDFSNGQALLPPGKTAHTLPQSIDWITLQSNVASVIAHHGGLAESLFTRDDMMKSGKSIWTWEMPK